ncbi:aspartyl-phosphate phosphatase Spo0E family protein [Metabacillus litoralis]|uniref:Aspartyl-phosphate phosphatase Spo0E family protein n=1 Tax=Metabacillus litoralis TaxID=152268 RepID=A0A5C6VV96_9BACI|nr:aspartyl-phosphate phosphatase Spo0E family protein [Metabacillus litoralis]TXC89462.1 aspartyl-phosphate phosphatase Spo0E family protein [Metabacillus litoralis]
MKIELPIYKLEAEISLLRMEMISTAEHKGIEHPETIKCSQALDVLLNRYQKIKCG